ncbi:hypothetical protein ACFLY6_03390, partial [Candidatus Dependentiae bacterium]
CSTNSPNYNRPRPFCYKILKQKFSFKVSRRSLMDNAKIFLTKSRIPEHPVLKDFLHSWNKLSAKY